MAAPGNAWLDWNAAGIGQSFQMMGQAAAHPVASVEQLLSGQGSASQLWNYLNGVPLSSLVDNLLSGYFTATPRPSASQVAQIRIQMDAQLKKAGATADQITQANGQLDAYVKSNGGGTFQVFSPGGLLSGQPNPEPNANKTTNNGWLLLAGMVGLGVLMYAVS